MTQGTRVPTKVDEFLETLQRGVGVRFWSKNFNADLLTFWGLYLTKIKYVKKTRKLLPFPKKALYFPKKRAGVGSKAVQSFFLSINSSIFVGTGVPVLESKLVI